MPENVGEMTLDELRAFVREEVKKALAEDNHFHTPGHAPYRVNLETKSDTSNSLPEWARKGA